MHCSSWGCEFFFCSALQLFSFFMLLFSANAIAGILIFIFPSIFVGREFNNYAYSTFKVCKTHYVHIIISIAQVAGREVFLAQCSEIQTVKVLVWHTDSEPSCYNNSFKWWAFKQKYHCFLRHVKY